MKHTGLALAVLVAGGVLLGAGEALAHVPDEQTQAPESPAPAQVQPQAAEPRTGEGPQGAARCRCSSAADCTCKRGECKCSQCKPRRQVLERLQGQPRQPAPAPARRQASAGFFI